MLGNVVFGNFWFSQCWEMQFLLFFSLPNVGKCSFCCFSVFPILGNAVFAVFQSSQCWETLFFAFSWFPNIGKHSRYDFPFFPTLGRLFLYFAKRI